MILKYILTILMIFNATFLLADAETKTAKELFEIAEKHCIKKNYQQAEEYYLLAANQQYVPAYRRLASLYKFGKLGAYDYDNAVKWLKKSNEQGDVGALGRLGIHYVQGRGVEENGDKGWSMLETAAQNGDAYSQNIIGAKDGFSFSCEKPLNKWLIASAKQGNADAQQMLGYIQYHSGNFEEACKWLKQASIQNHHVAQKELAQCYMNGEGVAQDLVEAGAWAFISNDWSESDISENIPSDDKKVLLKRILKLKNEIEQYRINNWKKTRTAHY